MTMITERTDGTAVALNVERIRADFPILGIRPRGKPLIYLDSAATSQKPDAVLEAMDRYYAGFNANIQIGRASCRERV